VRDTEANPAPTFERKKKEEKRRVELKDCNNPPLGCLKAYPEKEIGIRDFICPSCRRAIANEYQVHQDNIDLVATCLAQAYWHRDRLPEMQQLPERGQVRAMLLAVGRPVLAPLLSEQSIAQKLREKFPYLAGKSPAPIFQPTVI
jgi:hypothetical protein